MRAWMIPWLFPLALVVLVLVIALASPLVAGLVAGLVLLALVFFALPLASRTYQREHPDRRLPNWLPGGRPPR
jgi:hypothetical protein